MMTVMFRNAFFLSAWTAGFVFFNSHPVYADSSNWFARVWQSDDGLSDNNVTGVAQTSDGYLWVATQGGLVRFDGVQFKRLSLPTILGMPVGMIRALTVCNGDHLWLALEGGVVISVSPYETKIYTTAQGLPGVRPASITEDADGSVWVGYWDDSACRIANGEVKRFTNKEGLPYTGFCSLVTDVKKQLWFAEGNHVGIFRDGRFASLITTPGRLAGIAAKDDGGIWIVAGRKLFKYETGETLTQVAELPASGENIEPLALFEDRTKAVWIGTAANGLFRFDGTNVSHVRASHEEVRSVTEDREGNIWVGSSGSGLSRLSLRALELLGVEHGLPFETVQSVCEDADSNLWVVAPNGSLVRQQGKDWQLMNGNPEWPGGQASCVAADEIGKVWIGTVNNGLYEWNDGHYSVIRKTNGLASDKVWTLMTDSQNDIWISLSNPNCVERLRDGKFQKFDLPVGSHFARAMVEDAAHVIWMGTEDGKLLRVKDGVLSDETARTLTKLVPIRCLQATADGSLWIGYASAGLGRLKDGRFTQIGAEQGLPDDFISQILPDDFGRLWIASNKGIFEVQQPELETAGEPVKNVQPMLFGKNEGLPSLQANFGYGPNFIRLRDGRLCFSMLTGLVMVNPQKISIHQQAVPVLIERVSVDGKILPFPGYNQLLGNELTASNEFQSVHALEIPPEHRELKIDYNALGFAAPQNVRMRYQLLGYDRQPVETTQRSVTYSQIPPGRYQFQVTACNDSGVWNQTGAQLNFIVDPFFWQTWWFRAAALLAFTGVIVVAIYYISVRRLHRKVWRLEQESAVEKDRARIAKDLHDDLGAHLSQIAMLSELAQTDLEKPAQARSHIDQIFRNARLLTRSLDEIVWAVNPKNDTLERFVAHVCQFAPEFLRTADIRCRLDMPMDLSSLQLASNVRHQLYLGFKESLHNIVKHAEATEVWLRLKLTDGTIVFTIEDNGRGFETSKVFKNGEDGLLNLHDRMAEIGGRFEQESQPGQGTRTIFIAPIYSRP
ncbi:MAG TPA: two-component regulator propeller domain-containing protein [Verrucomicrobiae bacterium]|nr:two-component regulator propeller domain-containing protein [Verrucomicrobiae bacterium]